MDQGDLFDSHPAALARLLDAGAPGHGNWGHHELGAVLWFQLAAPLTADLGSDDAKLRARVTAILALAQPPIRTFQDLLHHQAPPLELLELTKEFAKAARQDPENRLPDEVATVLYYACIAASLIRYNHRLTGLEDAPFRQGVAWVIAQPWVGDTTKSLMRGVPMSEATRESPAI